MRRHRHRVGSQRACRQLSQAVCQRRSLLPSLRVNLADSRADSLLANRHLSRVVGPQASLRASLVVTLRVSQALDHQHNLVVSLLANPRDNHLRNLQLFLVHSLVEGPQVNLAASLHQSLQDSLQHVHRRCLRVSQAVNLVHSQAVSQVLYLVHSLVEGPQVNLAASLHQSLQDSLQHVHRRCLRVSQAVNLVHSQAVSLVLFLVHCRLVYRPANLAANRPVHRALSPRVCLVASPQDSLRASQPRPLDSLPVSQAVNPLASQQASHQVYPRASPPVILRDSAGQDTSIALRRIYVTHVQQGRSLGRRFRRSVRYVRRAHMHMRPRLSVHCARLVGLLKEQALWTVTNAPRAARRLCWDLSMRKIAYHQS